VSKAATITPAVLEGAHGEVVSELSAFLKEKSARISPATLAHLAGMAFSIAFPGARRDEKLANALARGVSMREKLAAEEGGSVSAEQAAQYLGVTKQSILNMAHAGKLLSWRAEKQGAFRFPAWQFHEGGRLPGLEDALVALGKESGLDDWGRIGFFLQSNGLLGNRRPIDLLRKNQLDAVLKAATAYVE